MKKLDKVIKTIDSSNDVGSMVKLPRKAILSGLKLIINILCKTKNNPIILYITIDMLTELAKIKYVRNSILPLAIE